MRKAGEYVRDGLIACLPPGVPLMGQIVRAKFIGKEKAEAALVLFDGLQGTVEVSLWTRRFVDAWAIRWLDTGGSAFHWTGSAWERLAPVQMTLDIRQAEMGVVGG